MSITLSTLMRISFTLFYRVNETQLFHALVLHLGCVCFGWKWFQEIIFPQTRMFGCHRKWYFPENDFRLTNIFTFDPEMIFHPYFHFKSFPEKERKREKREPRSERERERRESPDRATCSTIAPHRRAARSTIMIDEIARCDRRSSGAIDERDRWSRSTSALVGRAPLVDRRAAQSRSSIAPLVGRSHRPRLRSMSHSPRDLIFSSAGFDSFSFAAFCFFCRIWCIFCKNVWMNQTPKLIFRKTNFVTAKHMKTFSFPENSISGKWNIFRKYFYANQTQP